MNSKDVIVASRVDGEMRRAQLIICSECDSDTFSIYYIDGHSHLQCAHCSTTYCQQKGGHCAVEDEI